MYESLVELFEASCRKFKDREAYGTKAGGTWNWITFGEFKTQVDALRGALNGLGVGPGDRVAIVADNSVEWAAAAYATYGRGACFVPMYAAQLPNEWKFILNDCGAKVVFAATEEICQQLQDLKNELPTLEHVVGISSSKSKEDSYAALLEKGRSAPCEPVYPKAEDVAGYIYTSGTTGDPKGVMLTHRNICSNCAGARALFPLHNECSLAFLPWAHSFGQTCELHFLFQEGNAIAINDEVPNLINNLPEVRPTILVAVPRIFNRIYDGVHRQMAEKPAVIQALFKNGLACATRRNRGEPLGFMDSITLRLAEKLIFSKVRAKFGGRLKIVISGSAALNKQVALFIDALGIMVYEGYGLTETSPISTANFPGNRKIGSVGKPFPDVRVVLDETQSDQPGEGEILVYGPNVMKGYHNRPDENKAVFNEDGGLRTGDLGRIDAEGFLSITGRIKEQYKLSNGKYVAPASLEEELKLSPYIANIMLYGVNRPHNVALVVPDPDAVQRWASEQGVQLNGVGTNPRVMELLMAEVDRLSTKFKGFERPQKIAITGEDFTTANGLLTPSLKLKRRCVVEKYQETIDQLYH